MKLQIEITEEEKGTKHFCFHCQNESVSEYRNDEGRIVYTCSSCDKESLRVIAFGKNAIMRKDENDTLWHESVAVFVFDADGKILCFERTSFPVGQITVPAGHAEVDKTIEQSALMELEEEVGIRDADLEFVATEKISGDSCSWGSDDHVWHVYKACITDASSIKVNHEGRNPAWLSPQEILDADATVGVKHFAKMFV